LKKLNQRFFKAEPFSVLQKKRTDCFFAQEKISKSICYHPGFNKFTMTCYQNLARPFFFFLVRTGNRFIVYFYIFSQFYILFIKSNIGFKKSIQ